MIRIKLVRVGNVLIGETASDRWNMLTLGLGRSLPVERNQSYLKRLRRWGTKHGFEFSVTRNGSLQLANNAERIALGANPRPAANVA